jgi:hypothetical protein
MGAWRSLEKAERANREPTSMDSGFSAVRGDEPGG